VTFPMFSYAFALLVFVATVSALAPLIRTAKPIQDSYIVLFYDNATTEDVADALDEFEADLAVTYEFKYTHVFRGFAAKLTEVQLFQVRQHSLVEFVEQNQAVHINQDCPVQINADWGLDRVCKRDIVLDGTYSYPDHGASNIDAYIIDTGILITHQDFQGRASFGYKSNNGWPSTDDNGHGTHVASTVGGFRYGVAKRVNLIGVKVLSGAGSGTTAGVIAGVDWSVGSKRSRGRPSTGNMSLGGSTSAALNRAVDAASDAGVNMVVAAGNDNNNACNSSPASASKVICTGATDLGSDNNDNQYDVRSYFSNFGRCVSVFAPGSDILGAWIGSNTASRVISGTSMASPHVCGVASLALSQNPSWSFAQLKSFVIASATVGMIDLQCGSNAICNQSPNLLAFNGCE